MEVFIDKYNMEEYQSKKKERLEKEKRTPPSRSFDTTPEDFEAQKAKYQTLDNAGNAHSPDSSRI